MKMHRTGLALGVGAMMLASAATAQETTAQGTTMGQNWDAPLIDTFFNPGASATLKTEGEVRSSWQSLSEEHKQQARTDCENFGTQGTSAAGGGRTEGMATGGTSGISAEGGDASGGMSDGAPTADGGMGDTGGAASPIGQPTGTRAAGADDTTGQPDTKNSTVGESDATTADMGTSAGPGTSREVTRVTDEAMNEAVGTPAQQGTGAETNPGATGTTTGTGAANVTGMAGQPTSGTPSTAQGPAGFEPTSVSLTTWTQICQMVETL